MKDNIRGYFNDYDFRYTVFSNSFHIINFDKIVSLENNRVSFIYQNKRIIFKGNNFVLHKLLDKEVIINGSVLGVEVNEI